MLKYFKPPVFEDEAKTKTAEILNITLLVTFFLVGGRILAVSLLVRAFGANQLIQAVFMVALVGLLRLMRRGQVKAASIIFILAGWGMLTYQIWFGGGVYSSAFSDYVLIILAAGLLLGRRASLIFTGLCVLSGLVVAWAGQTGLIHDRIEDPVEVWVNYALKFLLVAIITVLVISVLNRAWRRVRNYEYALSDSSHKVELQAGELRQRDQWLQESERFNRRIAETSPHIIYIFDMAERRFVYNNRSLFETLNKNFGNIDDAAKPNKIFELLHPDDRPRIDDLLKRCATASDDDVFETEYRLRHSDGTWRWFVSTDTVFTRSESTGQVRQIIGMVQDITARKQAEEKLRENQQLLQGFIDNSSTIIYVKDLNGRYILVNRWFARFFNLDHEKVIGSTDFDIFTPHIAQTLQNNDQHVIETGQPIEIEEVVPYNDQLFTYISIKFPLLDLAGKPYAVAGISTDITARKQAEQALRDSQKQYSDLFEYATDAIFVESFNGQILDVNEKACDLLGYSKAELLALKVADIVPQRIPQETNAIQTGLRQRRRLIFEGQNRRKDGSLVDVEVSLRGINLDTQPVAQVFARDITARKQAEQSLKAYAAELERSNRELEDFAYVASHDLQEPLRKIQAFGDRLAQRYNDILDERGRDYLARMQNAAARMQVLIQDLLTFSRVTTKAQPFAPVNLNLVVKNVLSDLETYIEEVAGQVHVDNLPTIEADPTQMRQLFQNVISNALKFHRPDAPPVVKIQSGEVVAARPPACRIIVTDNGIGFEEAYRERIFGVFQRLHSRNVYPGTGVGLAVCRKIANRHNGTITAVSRPGQGAEFIITLPVQQNNPEIKHDA